VLQRSAGPSINDVTQRVDQFLNAEISRKIDKLNHFLTLQNLPDCQSRTFIPDAGAFKASYTKKKEPQFYHPLICLVTQGEKKCHVGDQTFHYTRGDFFINVLPMPVTAEITQASADKPFMSATLSIDLVKLADVLLKIERLESHFSYHTKNESSCLLVGSADEALIDAFHRLMQCGLNEADAAVLGPSIIEEIYYRILTSEYGYALRQLLSQYGQVQPISKAITHIHKNIEQPISVQDLASMSNMSKTTFFNTFKKLMHVPPNQYIKSSKLQKAQVLLKNGMQANEASFQVGYNSFSQFSREYKRHFGFSPSETLKQAS